MRLPVRADNFNAVGNIPPKIMVTAMIIRQKRGISTCIRRRSAQNERVDIFGVKRVAETSLGKVRLLLAEDGKALSPERMAEQRAKLADIVAIVGVSKARADDDE